ncbi:hypothetical protein F0310_04450 (plasmid) [Borrelia sp. A-FGy1]|uniref:hypothetical protein n=1 Tax=Borrelia sp. A-FGy1 TaxID=2608247 RepID=UPI0015F64F3C|nr:hypothetical protein [Borrelia sp. A-FGy1]QMU99664.1 hypothetical protein F0310_04450 [Borrelia sp. A-FGy1]
MSSARKRVGIIGSITAVMLVAISGLGTYAKYAFEGLLAEFRREIVKEVRGVSFLDEDMSSIKGKLESFSVKLSELDQEMTGLKRRIEAEFESLKKKYLVLLQNFK